MNLKKGRIKRTRVLRQRFREADTVTYFKDLVLMW